MDSNTTVLDDLSDLTQSFDSLIKLDEDIATLQVNPNSKARQRALITLAEVGASVKKLRDKIKSIEIKKNN